MNRYSMRRSVHSSWMIAVAGAMVVVGVALARVVPVGVFASIAWLLTASALLLLACTGRKVMLVPAAIMGGLLLGLWRGSIDLVERTAYETLRGTVVTITGRVADDSDVTAKGDTVLRLTALRYGEHELQGQLWVTTSQKNTIQRSDQVTVSGKLQDGFGTFVGALYRAKVEHVERPVPGDVALAVRDWFADAVRRAVPEPQASLGVGYLVGQRRALPSELDQALTIAGLTHIVVASGYNLTILVRLARRCFEKVSKYLSALTSGAMIAGFIAVTGLSPSMSRAGLIAGLSLLAWYYGRKFHPFVLLPFAASVTVLVQPSYAWGDLGWMLSFAAFAGVMIVAPLGQAYFFGEEKPKLLRQIIGETVAATVCTAPILLYAFGQISLVSLPANILILPLVPLAMLLTMIAGIGALLLPAAAGVIGAPASWLLGYMTQVAQGFASLPWAQQELVVGEIGLVVMYAGLVTVTGYMYYRHHRTLRDVNLVD